MPECFLFSHVLLCATPWTIACQATLCMGFSRQEYWSGLLCSPPRYLLDPGIEPISYVFCIGRRVLYHWRHLGSPLSLLQVHNSGDVSRWQSRRTWSSLFPTNTSKKSTGGIVLREDTWKQAEGLLYNQGCKKNTQIIR